MATRKVDTTLTALFIALVFGLLFGFCRAARASDLKTPLLISSLYIGGDRISTKIGLQRGGVEKTPMSPALRTGLQAGAFIGADVLAQKSGKGWPPWLVRGAELGYTAWLIRHNVRDRRAH